ncbi:MAG: hypothetical protein NVS9B1_12280 [Candidatus Dormibacteraceae bacterium]
MSVPKAAAVLLAALVMACAGQSSVPASLPATDPVGVTDAAIAEQQAVLRTRPNNHQALVALSAAYLQKVREVSDPSYYAKVESLLQTALVQQPEDVNALTLMGSLSLGRHQFADGLAWGTRARAAGPTSAEPLGVIVDAQVELGRYPEAVATAQAMVNRRPDLASYSRVSYLRELHGDVPGAIVAMKQAVTAGGDGGENVAYVEVLLGNLYFNSGDVDRAAAAYTEAERFFPGYIHALAGQAQVAAARGRVQLAVDTYRKVTEIFPLPQYVIALGDAYAALGDEVNAGRTYDLAEAEQKLYQAAGVNLDAELALYAADHHRSVELGLAAARRAIVDRPTIGSADVLAWTLYQAGDYGGALAASGDAHRLGTQEALLYFHSGMIKAKLGMRPEARADLSRALQINPNFSLLWQATARTTLAGLGSG